ncbi:Lon protease [Candidatus Entotheonellaceae bacterium PAL068K]
MAPIPDDESVFEDHSELPAILPIFPLPNVVLMPNASLPLFIFEDRYKQMIRDCLQGDRYLSVALLQKGWEQQSGPPRPHPIAGWGRIMRASHLPNDCMDIVVQGMGRLQMTTFYDDRAYLRASVTTLHPTYPEGEDLTRLANTMRQRFVQLLDAKGITALELRTNLKLLASPIDLVFFIATHLPLDPYAKQQVLQTIAVDEQITHLMSLLDRLLGSQLN